MGSGAQNAQATIERHLKDLSVRKPRAEAAPVYSQIGAEINAVVCSDVKRARRGGVVDLNGPDRQIRKRAAACTADVGPGRSAIRSPENMTISAKSVDYCVGDLGVSRIDLHLIDSGAARRQIVLCPHRPMVDSDENVAGGCEFSPSGGINGGHV